MKLFPQPRSRRSRIAAIYFIAGLALLTPPALLAQEGEAAEQPVAEAEAAVATEAEAPKGSPEARKTAEEILETSQVESTISSYLNQFSAMQARQMKRHMESGNFPQERRAKFEELQQRSLEMIREELAWEKIKGEIITIYVELFTEEELTQLLEFYKSPVGTKLIGQQPELSRRTLAITEARTMALMPKIEAMAREMMSPETATDAPAPSAPAQETPAAGE